MCFGAGRASELPLARTPTTRAWRGSVAHDALSLLPHTPPHQPDDKRPAPPRPASGIGPLTDAEAEARVPLREAGNALLPPFLVSPPAAGAPVAPPRPRPRTFADVTTARAAPAADIVDGGIVSWEERERRERTGSKEKKRRGQTAAGLLGKKTLTSKPFRPQLRAALRTVLPRADTAAGVVSRLSQDLSLLGTPGDEKGAGAAGAAGAATTTADTLPAPSPSWPLDWTAKALVRFSSSAGFQDTLAAANAAAGAAEAAALRAAAAAALGLGDEGQNLHASPPSTPASRLAAALLSTWRHPECRVEPTMLAAASPSWRAARAAAWREAARSAYRAVRAGAAPALLILTPPGAPRPAAVLFRGAGVGGCARVSAILTGATLGVVAALREDHGAAGAAIAPGTTAAAAAAAAGGEAAASGSGAPPKALLFLGGRAVHGLFDFLYADAGGALSSGAGGVGGSGVGGVGGGRATTPATAPRFATLGRPGAAATPATGDSGGAGASSPVARLAGAPVDVPTLLAPAPFPGGTLARATLQAAPAVRGRHRVKLSMGSVTAPAPGGSGSGSGVGGPGFGLGPGGPAAASFLGSNPPLPPWVVAAAGDALRDAAGGAGLDAAADTDPRTLLFNVAPPPGLEVKEADATAAPAGRGGGKKKAPAMVAAVPQPPPLLTRWHAPPPPGLAGGAVRRLRSRGGEGGGGGKWETTAVERARARLGAGGVAIG